MINMKLTPEEAKEESGCIGCESASNQPAYPWGLSLSLEDKVLSKLGIDTPPTPGTKMMLHALVEVTNTSQHENQEGKDVSISLQITDMELSEAISADPKNLYPNSGMN